MSRVDSETYIRMLSGFRGLVKAYSVQWDELPNEISGRCERPSRRVDVGVEMSLCPEVGFFTLVSYRLKKITASCEEYQGELPEPFSLTMSQSYIRSVLGEPQASSGPFSLPVVGKKGGWDCYMPSEGLYAGVTIYVHYLESRVVDSLVFTIDK